MKAFAARSIRAGGRAADEFERGGLGQPDQLAFLVDMQRRRDIPALLAAQGRPPAPQQRHLLTVL